MLKTYALTLGLAIILAGCGQSTPDAATVPAPSIEQAKPERADSEGRPERPRGGERRGPREIAYTACADLALEDACSFETKRGTRRGVCKTLESDSRLVCFGGRPDGQRPRGE